MVISFATDTEKFAPFKKYFNYITLKEESKQKSFLLLVAKTKDHYKKTSSIILLLELYSYFLK